MDRSVSTVPLVVGFVAHTTQMVGRECAKKKILRGGEKKKEENNERLNPDYRSKSNTTEGPTFSS